MMAKFSFPVERKLNTAAITFLVSVGAGAINASPAEPHYHCPAGQIYRVSKKLCVPKGSQQASWGLTGKSDKSPEPPRAPNGADEPPPVKSAPQISPPDRASPAAEESSEESNSVKAETPRIPQPEPVTPPAPSDVKSEHDAVLPARIARDSDTSDLEKQVALCQEALKEPDRERAPLKWAAIQNNLANALAALGERESGTANLEEAVALYREAGKPWTRESAPLEWATIEDNLGEALAVLGERESEMAELAEALAVKREVRDWAVSTGNQGVTLMRTAERTSDSTMAITALRRIEMAFMAMRDGGHEPLFADYFEEQLPKARALVQRLSER